MKDSGYPARFIFLAPPDSSELEKRLRKRGLDTEDKIQERLEIAAKELEQAKVEGFHDVTFVNNDLEATYKSIESYIFATDEDEDAMSDTEGSHLAISSEDKETKRDTLEDSEATIQQPVEIEVDTGDEPVLQEDLAA